FDQSCNPAISTIIVADDLPDGDGVSLIEALQRRSLLQARRLNFIVTTSAATVNLAVSAMRASATDLLEKPFVLTALDAPLMRIRAGRVETVRQNDVVSNVGALADEVRRLASLLQKDAGSDVDGAHSQRRADKDLDAVLVKKLIRAEYSRARVIGGKILGDLAWNILLDLLLASLEGRHVAVSSACIVAGVATTTALRLVNRMVEDQVLVRIPDENDGRRHFLAIEPTVEQALKAYILDLAEL
ncbi:MAG: hypothetical protein RIS17_1715, partial [Pseudomonadota bacterium]